MSKLLDRLMKPTKAHNSFWADEFDIDFDSKVMRSALSDTQVESLKKFRLSSARKAISNFVTIATGKQIPVRFSTGKDSYTDGDQVVLSGDIDDKDNFDIGVGLALHEGSHILLTDFTLLKGFTFIGPRASQIPSTLYDKANAKGVGDVKVLGIVKDLLNIVEDRRIDNYIYNNAPGYREYYKKLYEKYFGAKIITDALASSQWRDENVNSYMARITNFMNPNSDLDSLKGLRKIWNKLDVHSISRLKNTTDAYTIALDIFEIIIDSIDAPAPKQAKPKQNKSKKSQPKQKQPKQSDEDEEGDDEGDKEQSADGDEEDSDEKSDELGKKGTSKKEQSEDQESDEEDESENDSNDESDEDESDEQSEEEKQMDYDADEDANDSDDDSEQSDDSADGESDESDEDDDSADTDADMDDIQYEDLSNNKKALLEKVLKAQRQFLQGEIKKEKISEALQSDITQIEDAGAEMTRVADEFRGLGKGVDVVVYKKLTPAMLEKETVPLGNKGSYGNRKHQTSELYSVLSEEEIAQAEQMGTMLGKKLQVRGEARTTVYNRQRSGRIDNRMISSLGFDNESVFVQKFIDQYKKANIHLSLDASSSMAGTKWTKTIINTIALAKAVSMIENLSMQISVRYSSTLPEIVIVWDSRKESYAQLKALIPYLRPNGCTPEGLCFEAINKLMVPSNANMDSYFVNISDGEPYYATSSDSPEYSTNYVDYSGTTAENHTKREIDKIRNSGIGVISYFVSTRDNQESDAFKRMYGISARFININSISEVTNTLNKLFMTK